ncbi:uncharacterized protein LAJ45_10346 [Morchella importuna]|uniref:uncharacterized protein n=1 Tax=Morchella importuna TaxID=1174673 RepID=UPI001E8E2AD6|nr:uncharacterized protein LAJ45_10346 [Morchella importuna]KAH8145706.1 hypothetical protein LAJ45_10346 [Morchella importuna]
MQMTTAPTTANTPSPNRTIVEYELLISSRTLRAWYQITYGFGEWYVHLRSNGDYEFYSAEELWGWEHLDSHRVCVCVYGAVVVQGARRREC